MNREVRSTRGRFVPDASRAHTDAKVADVLGESRSHERRSSLGMHRDVI
jgi:hypothetical protein